MGQVLYDSKALIPAPLLSIEKQYQKTGDGTIVGKIYNLTINGVIIAWKGSPNSSGDFHTTDGYPADESIASNARLGAIFRKQEAIRDLFSQDGLVLDISPLNGSQSLRCNPRINSISFSEGVWHDRCDYTIQLEADDIYPFTEDDFTEYISSASENWSISADEGSPEGTQESRTYTLSHTVSAVGKRFYVSGGSLEKEAWKQARDYVLSRLGFDSVIALSSGVNSLPDYYGGYNHVRNENISKLDGTYEVTETWVLASGSALEDFNINVSDSLDQPYPQVSIEGNIRGLEVRDSEMKLTTSKYDNALTKFTFASGMALSRAQAYSGLTLNIDPLSYAIGKNPVAGTINYSFEYDTRPSRIVTGSKSEVISINDNVDGQSFARIFVLGRSAGPVLQDLATKPENVRTLNIELVMEPPGWTTGSEAEIRAAINANPRRAAASSGTLENIIKAANPANNGYTTVFEGPKQENWDITSARYSLSMSWTYE